MAVTTIFDIETVTPFLFFEISESQKSGHVLAGVCWLVMGKGRLSHSWLSVRLSKSIETNQAVLLKTLPRHAQYLLAASVLVNGLFASTERPIIIHLQHATWHDERIQQLNCVSRGSVKVTIQPQVGETARPPNPISSPVSPSDMERLIPIWAAATNWTERPNPHRPSSRV